MGIKVRDLVENITDHVESVDFTTLATSEGQLYDNKEEIRRAFIIHKNDTECEAVGICNKTEECASSLENNYTAHSCNLHQPGCSIECGPNGACIHSGGISYCSCDFDWLNIYYGERCDRVAVSLEAELGITFGCLGAVLIFVFVGCLIRSRNKNKESYCEDEAGDWRGFSGTDSRWLTFSGRYSTREIPYKRSLRDGRHLVPAHDPFGSSRMTRPGLYLPGNAGTDTSFVNNVTSYSKFSSDVDFSIRRPHVSKEPSAVYLSDQSWRSTGYTNSVFYNYPEERTHL
ncbi:uncharacterized protein LOC125682318 [Ostrea edulis]|uniref:uncharacterized protein LOC125682318 n=1 Tax=Ostrea edulis TaxID=37623 RepID=UPI0024AEBF9B|nr:uncharacterized protein LOC125682318 [Ostrea edulis]